MLFVCLKAPISEAYANQIVQPLNKYSTQKPERLFNSYRYYKSRYNKIFTFARKLPSLLILKQLINTFSISAFYCSPTEQFKCRNGTCLPISQRCDGKLDCLDFGDEIGCPQATCGSYQFRCNNGSCIPKSWRWLAIKGLKIYFYASN